MSLNKVNLLGNLGKDPELRYTPSGVAVASFSMAMTEKYKDREGNKKEKTEWANVVVWQSAAEFISKFATKGTSVFVEGKMATRSYEDRDGNKRYITEVIVSGPRSSIQITGNWKKNDSQESSWASSVSGSENQQQKNGSFEEPAFNPDDEIPF